jgi:hypothetical protein
MKRTPSLRSIWRARQRGQHLLQHLVVLALVDELGGERSVQRLDAGDLGVGFLAVVEELAQQAAILVDHVGGLVQHGIRQFLAGQRGKEGAEGLDFGVVRLPRVRALHVVGHRHVVVPLHARHVAAPGAEGLPVLDAGLGQGHALGIVEAAEQALRQRIAAERAEHAEDVRLGDVLRFVGAEYAHRQHAGGDQQFFRGVGAHRRYDLAAGARFPGAGVVVALLIPVLELVEQSISHCCLLCCPSAARIAANRCFLIRTELLFLV